MRSTLAVAAILSSIVGALMAPPAKADLDVSFGFFYSNLSPHGSWLVSAEYGRVWQPRVYAPGWNPYHDGHWVYTDLGWVWVSDYEWGAIPYHYGTWVVDPRWGWVWVPGTTWAPSWVVFCEGPDYIGWAPVPPGFSVGVRLTLGDVHPDRFVVVPARHFVSHRIRSHAVPRAGARPIIERARIVTNFHVQSDVVVNRGPDVRTVERHAAVRIKPRRIETVPRAAPSRFARDDLRARSGERRFRAARPYSADEPLPGQRSKATGRHEPRERADVGKRRHGKKKGKRK